MNDPKLQAMFKLYRYKKLSSFMFSQNYYELFEGTKRANRNIYHIFKSTKNRDVQKFHQDKADMDKTLNEFKYLTSTCWNEKYQAFTIDMTKDKYTSR